MFDGILLIDKPAGITSAHVIAIIKRKFNLKKLGKKIGHCGTLDPFATGLLIALVGKATKKQDQLLSSYKSYEGELLLGLETDTLDITGKTVAEDQELALIKGSDLQELEKNIITQFTGEQKQLPPAFSAIRVNGRRSYDLARAGVSVELKERDINITDLSVKFIDEKTLHYQVRCSKGTYIRSLARDIGHFLQTHACVKTLRRTTSEPFRVSDARTLAEIEQLGLEKCLIS